MKYAIGQILSTVWNAFASICEASPAAGLMLVAGSVVALGFLIG